ncbi:MAG: response regulator [Acidimicrobiia bacterium]
MQRQHVSSANILVIEDEQRLNDLYCLVLKNEGYNVVSALDGLEGLDALKAFTPDLVLLDLSMPNLDGIGFLKSSKIHDNYPQTKIIAFTNLDRAEDVSLAFELGITRYVLKSSTSPRGLIKLVNEET